MRNSINSLKILSTLLLLNGISSDACSSGKDSSYGYSIGGDWQDSVVSRVGITAMTASSGRTQEDKPNAKMTAFEETGMNDFDKNRAVHLEASEHCFIQPTDYLPSFLLKDIHCVQQRHVFGQDHQGNLFTYQNQNVFEGQVINQGKQESFRKINAPYNVPPCEQSSFPMQKGQNGVRSIGDRFIPDFALLMPQHMGGEKVYAPPSFSGSALNGDSRSLKLRSTHNRLSFSHSIPKDYLQSGLRIKKHHVRQDVVFLPANRLSLDLAHQINGYKNHSPVCIGVHNWFESDSTCENTHNIFERIDAFVLRLIDTPIRLNFSQERSFSPKSKDIFTANLLYFVSRPHMHLMTHLNISNYQLGAELSKRILSALTVSHHLPNLQNLNIACLDISTSGALIANLITIESLKTLDYKGNKIDTNTLQYLRTIFNHANISRQNRLNYFDHDQFTLSYWERTK